MPGAIRSALIAGLLAAHAAGGGLSAQSELVIVKEGTKEYHRPGCEAIKDGRNVLALTRGQATARGLTPHPACDPAKAAPSSGSGSPDAPESPATVTVYTDGSRYYHKKDCAKLGKDPKKADLEEAGKKLWPCPTCKPPIRKRRPG